MKTKNNFKFRNRSNKKILNQKGGTDFIDSNFISCFDNNLTKIMDAIAMYSGIHAIDPVKAREFIENQTSPIRREAAENLISNTHYITLQQVYDIVGELIEEVYSKFDESETIYLYSGYPEKSFYFLCVIALHHIRQKGYKEPVFIKTLGNELFDIAENSPIIILDDVSYSGSQLSELLKKIYYEQVYKRKKTPPNIYILLIALNDISKRQLSLVPSSERRTRSGIYIDDLKESPFKLIYLEKYLYKPLISILGIEKYNYVKLLFASWLCFEPFVELPCVSLYLDHKIADPVSTFTITLIYGQVPPSNTDFSYFNDLYQYPPSFSHLDPIEKDRLLSELSEDFKSINNKSITLLPKKIIEKFIKIDSETTDKPSTEILFYPFVSSCNQNRLLNEIIQDRKIKELDYFIFMLPQDCFADNNCSISYGNIEEYLNYKNYLNSSGQSLSNTKNEFTETGLEIAELHKKITSFKCPVSWYKKGDLKMGCTVGGGKKNKTRRVYKNRKTRRYRKNKK